MYQFKSSILTFSILLTAATSFEASALPSFTRQTGAACSQCHTQSFGPNLTPFGRDFKLSGYTMGNNNKDSKIPAVSGMVQGSFTHIQQDKDPSGSNPGNKNNDATATNNDDDPSNNKNNTTTFDQASLFYAGRVYEKVGAFSQLTFDGYAKRLALDNTDIRFADNTELFDMPITYGISANNNPTVQDLWNTTSAWGFPYASSATQPGVGTSALIDGTLGTQVGGATAYTMIDNLLYLEAGGYTSLSNNVQKGLGVADAQQNQIDGAAPYWRVALQKDWKGHFVSIGHYGMMANVFPARDRSTGKTDHYTDVALDATYQYMPNPKHIFETKLTYIYEDQKLSASRILNSLSPNAKTYLNTFKINTAYTFDQTYGITLAYNQINGSNNATLNSEDGSYSFYKPNSNYFTAELVYVPFGKTTSYLAPWLNLRTSLQYIGYTKANGASFEATTNNTFLINGQLAF